MSKHKWKKKMYGKRFIKNLDILIYRHSAQKSKGEDDVNKGFEQ